MDFSFKDDQTPDIESRRFDQEAQVSRDLRSGRLKKDKSRYSNTEETGTGSWDGIGKRRNWRPGLIILSLASVFVIWAIVLVIGSALRSGKPDQTKITPVVVPEVPKMSAEDEQKLRSTLAKARLAIDDFYAAKSHAGRMPYIRDPERVLPRMEKFYENERLGKFRPLKFGTLMAYRSLRPQTDAPIVFTWAILLDGSRRIVAVEESQNGDVKIDWECLVGYSAMPWPEFMEKRPSDTLVFRVIVSQDRNNSNPMFSNKDYTAFLLQDVSRIYSVHGYARKGSLGEKALTHQLRGFPETFVVADLRYPKGREDAQHVEIVDVRSMNWVEGFGPQHSFVPTQFLFFENE